MTTAPNGGSERPENLRDLGEALIRDMGPATAHSQSGALASTATEVAQQRSVGDESLPCLARGEAAVDGAVIPVACDLWHEHDRRHWDDRVFTFWEAPDA